MNEELTNEVLEAIVNCDGECIGCTAQSVCDAVGIKRSLATALLEERAKPKDDVWKNAPHWAKGACVIWDDGEGQKFTRLYNSERYTRELPKSRARQIAEQEGHGLAEKYGWNASAKELVTNVMESALNKYADEIKWKK